MLTHGIGGRTVPTETRCNLCGIQEQAFTPAEPRNKNLIQLSRSTQRFCCYILVGTVTRYGLTVRGLNPSRGKRFSFLHDLDRLETTNFSKEITTILRVRGGADKSLARPGRKQATATKLGIYLTHSPRSAIHFLTRCSNFCRPLKKIQNIVRPTRSPRQQ